MDYKNLSQEKTEVIQNVDSYNNEMQKSLIDKIFLDDFSEMNTTLSDREVKTLFDGEVEFDDENYDVEEIVILNGLEVLANEKDFEGIPYLVIPKDSIEYKVVFDDTLNISEIDEDETLVFNFLGFEVKLSKWDNGEITFSKGKMYPLNEGESVVVDGKTILLDMVLEDAVYVKVGEESKKVKEVK